MKLYDDGEFTALSWVKQALDATLAQARESLEVYVEQPDDLTPMRACVEHLHQVQGTLRMVELYGAAMVVENMERLAEALVANSVRQRDEGYSVLMRGMVQLPDYLERLQSGHKDIPIVLLPLLNDLRAVRGENLLSESALFAPDLELPLPANAGGAAAALPVAELRTQALRLRLAYQAALLKWFRDEGASAHLRRLIEVLDRLRSISHGAESRRLWWIAAGVVDAVESGDLEASVAVKLLFGRVDREIHRFAQSGEAGFTAEPPRDLTKNLLYYVAHTVAADATPASARGAEIRATYKLDTLLPTASELQHAQGSMTGRNKNLLGTVSAAIKDDLVRVKEALDIFLRSRSSDAGELASHVEVLDRVADTLGMLGLGVPRRVVGEQRGVIEEMTQRRRPIDEGALLDVAGALLYVEASLDDHIERLGATSDDDGEVRAGEIRLPKAEVRKILDALMREASVNIQQAKQDVIAFIESPWDHQRVIQIPRLLEEIAGALRMLGLADAGDLMTAVVRFVEVELIAHKRVPTAEQMDKLADALAAIEYYLEATREQRRGRDRILEVARESLEALGYWPLPAALPQPPTPPTPPGPAQRAQSADAASPAMDPPRPNDAGEADVSTRHFVPELDGSLPTIEMVAGDDLSDLMIGEAAPQAPAEHDLSGLRLAETGPSGADTSDDSGWIEVEEEIDEDVATDDVVVAGFEGAAGEEIDDDIREVFIEEVEEEIGNLRQQLPAWSRTLDNPDNLDELKAIRRSFHTLKGSGRLVGALALGEFSWKVENMLNRVLDRSIQAGPSVVALVQHAIDAIPVLLGALRGQSGGRANIAGIMDTADRIAAGEDASVPAHSAGTRKVRRTVRRRVRVETGMLPAFDGNVQSAGNLAGEADFSDAAGELVAGPLPNIDPLLFDILQSEVAAHLGVMEDYLARCEPDALQASEPLLRAAHTLNGAIAMVEIPAIGNVLAPLENYIKRLRGVGQPPSTDGIAALADTIALTREAMSRLEAGNSDLPDSTALVARMVALRDALPEVHTADVWASDAVEPIVADTPLIHGEVPQSLIVDEAPTIGEPDDGMLDEAMWQEIIELATEPVAPVDPFAPDISAALAAFEAPPLPGPSDEQTPAVAHDSAFEAMFGELTLGEDDADAEEDAGTTPMMTYDEALSAFVEETSDDEAPPEVGAPPSFDLSDLDLDAELPALDVFSDTTTVPVPGPDSTDADVEPADDLVPDDDLVTDDEATLDTGASAAPAARVPATLDGPRSPPLADDTQPDGPLDAADADDDLLDIFVQESADILDHADALVSSLRESPDDRAPIVGLQRDLHTLKGGARMAGLAPIGDLSHAMESLVDAVGEGRLNVDRAAVESLERGFDRLHVLVQRVAQRRAIAMPAHAIARFESLVGGMDIAAEFPAAEPSVEESAGEPRAAVQEAAQARRPAPRHLPSILEQEEATHAPQEMIRVRSDLLDSLVNYAGEVSIYRSRLEQQISTFRFNLVELDQTVARLREQLRKLEMETEAQIIARYQREQHEEGVFDPLELDRFSQLQQLSRALGESVSDLVSIQNLLDDQTRQSETLLLQQSRVSSDLQEGLMRTRMVPFDSLVPNLRRTLRQAAHELGKRAQLKVDGAHGEMDRNLLERMKAPFEHMLRNALAHGIETPEQREAAGKPAEGTVNIAVSRESTEVVLRVSDDGRGMDRDAIRRQAIERGLLKPEVELPDRDLYAFVLETGFSTARELTQLAGRGVGMDVVHNEIKQLGGSLVIDSTPARGTMFTIRLPFTLAVTQAILVKLGESAYAVPMSSVQGVARISRDDLERRIAEGEPRHAYAGEEYAIYDLAQLLGLPRSRSATEEAQVPLLMTRTGEQRAAVRIDGVIGSREIVVKSVGPQVSSVPGIFGATIMGDGSVVIILDLAPLVRRLAALRERIHAGIEAAPSHFATQPERATDVRDKPLVMVVDDSITMRKVTTRVLERVDYEVLTAKDGLDALEKLQDNVPDLMLLDIEMPRMDGYELATYMRNDVRLRQVPIIMITSRTGEKHRQRALEIGVERYLGKPYQEDELLRNVQEVLRRERV